MTTRALVVLAPLVLLACASAPAVAVTPPPPPASSTDARPAPLTDEGRIAQKYAAGAYDHARALAKKLLADREAAAGPNHPSLVPALRALAAIAVSTGAADEAEALFRRSFSISEGWIASARATSTESHLAALFDYLRDEEDLVYSFAASRPSDEGARKLALLVSVLRKGRSLEELARTYEVFRGAARRGDAAQWTALRDARARYATLSLVGAPAADVDAVAAKAEQLEGALTQGSAFAQLAQGALAMNTNVPLALDQLAVGVPMGGAFVDYIEYRPFDFGDASHPPRGWGARQYLALVVKSGGATDLVPIGAAEGVDATVASFVSALSNRDSDATSAATTAYTALFAPVRPKLKYDGVDYVDAYIYLSPDGELARVPFEALRDGDKYLLDVFRFTYATSGRDAFLHGARFPKTKTFSIFADPDFSASVPRALSGKPVDPLPGTRDEAMAIQKLFPRAHVALGGDATKDALLAVEKPGILHVATHGVFLDDHAAPATGSRALVLDTETTPAAALRRSPLVRSALLLSASPSAPTNGGFVSALEASGMDLAGTQLVVLSACETARGQTRPGEGVVGLRRALLAAGAETVVSSLWRVDDAVTRDLMVAYYQNLTQRQGRVEAMHSAAKAIRAAHPHPYFWAPFVVFGVDSAIEGADDAAIVPPVAPPRPHGLQVTPMSTEPIRIGPK